MNNWFDEFYYLNSKLIQLKLRGIKNVNNYEYDYHTLKEAIGFVGLTPEEHYLLFGRDEDLNPNPYFNENEYLTSKLLSLQEDSKYKSEWIDKSIDDLRAYMINIAHITPIEHYTTIGWYETRYDGSLLNPSNIFSADEYFRNKLAHLQSINYIDPQTGTEAKNFQIYDIINIFKNQHIDPLTHFLLYGHSELINLPISPDRYEPNNSIEEATVLDGSIGFLKTLSIHHEVPYNDDEDYFKFILTIEGNKENFIGVSRTIPYYGLDLEIYDSKFNKIYWNHGLYGKDFFSLEGLPSGEYFLKLSPAYSFHELTYDLSYNLLPYSNLNFSHSEFSIGENQTAYLVSINNLTYNSFKQDCYTDKLVIDAEKSFWSLKDNNMCWAATAANMLTWTGWGKKGLETSNDIEDNLEDRVFSYFVDNFTKGYDTGGNIFQGIQWFFDGRYDEYENLDKPNSEKNGGNLIHLPATNYLCEEELSSIEDMHKIDNALHNGAAVGISIELYNKEQNKIGNHALTCWGEVKDNNLSSSDPNYYTGIILSDSDNDGLEPFPFFIQDEMKIFSLYYEENNDFYYINLQGGIGILYSYTILDRCSALDIETLGINSLEEFVL